MPRTRLTILVLLMCCAAGGLLWYRHVHTTEYILRKTIRRLAENVTKESGESNLVGAAKMLALSEAVAPRLEVSVQGVPLAGGMSAEEFTSKITRGRAMTRSLHLELLDVLVTSVSPVSAVVECELRVTGNINSEQLRNRFKELYHLVVSLEKPEGNYRWRFNGFHERDLIQR